MYVLTDRQTDRDRQTETDRQRQTHILNNSFAFLLFVILLFCRGLPRKPPSPVTDQLKFAAKRMSLGHRLCRSRDPDFLLDIIQKQVDNSDIIG